MILVLTSFYVWLHILFLIFWVFMTFAFYGLVLTSVDALSFFSFPQKRKGIILDSIWPICTVGANIQWKERS